MSGDRFEAFEGVVAVERLLAYPAKILCSAIWVSGREIEEAKRNSVFYYMPPELAVLIEVDIDHDRREVSMTIRLDADTVPRLIEAYRSMYPEVHYPEFDADWEQEAARLRAQGAVTRTARYTGDQGCLILPLDGSEPAFTPVPVESALPDPSTLDWPMGDRVPEASYGLDPAELDEAVDAAFGNGDSCTSAFLVLHHGRIVAERYALGTDHETQLESWSMGKALTATLLGLLICDGHLSLDDPAPVSAWREPGDPRGEITVRDLMRMSSGLEFSGADDGRAAWKRGVPDHLLVYSEAIDVFDFSTSRPPEFPPNTVGRYRNCDPLTLGAIVKQIVTERIGEEYLTWPQRALFDRIGIRRQVMETDRNGNFILTGFDYGTARNWARLGLLYAQDGVWEGEHLLPEGYVDFVREPAPAWDTPRYGAQFWLNRTGTYDFPEDAYYMGGAGEQRVFIVPSRDLVVVRMGHRRGTDAALHDLNQALPRLIEVVDAAS